MDQENKNNSESVDQEEVSITQQSKEAMLEVFNNFDKDKSGFIELNEIEIFAKEIKMKENEIEECQKAMAEIDVNQDGKICFEEFWEWWRRGGASQKMNKLIYYKLKAMKLLSKANSEFIRFGGSLEAQYDDKKYDTHYVSLNYMEQIGRLQLDLLALFFHPDVIEERQSIFQDIEEGIKPENVDNFSGLIFRFKCKNENKEQIKNKLQELMSDFVITCQLYNQLNIFYEFFKNAHIQTQIIEDEVCGIIRINESQINVIENNKQIGQAFRLLLSYLKMSQMRVEQHFSVRNGLRQFLDNPQEYFVKQLLQGFIIKSKIIMNQGYLKKFRSILKSKIEQDQWMTKNEKALKTNTIVIATLLNASKIKASFKDIDDIEDFFKGMGLEQGLQDQPTNEQVLQEVGEFYYKFIELINIKGAQINENNNQDDKQNNKNKNSEQSTEKTTQILFAKLLGLVNCFQSDQGTISVHYKKSLVKINFSMDGLSDLIAQLLKQQESD